MSANQNVAAAVPLARRTGALWAIIAASLNLRIAMVVVGPVIVDIQDDLGMSSSVAGLLWAIPFLCIGLAALLAGALVERLGTRRTVIVSLLLIGLGSLLRAGAPSAFLVLAMTVVLGLGIAFASVALPVLVKDHFPEDAGRVTGLYIAAQAIGGTAAALLAVPLSRALGGWREAFAAAAIPIALSLPVWLYGAPRGRPSRGGTPTARAFSGVAVKLAAVFGLQAVAFTALMTWIATVYREHGWSASKAALTTASIAFLTVLAAAVIPRLSDAGDRRRWIAVATLPMTAGVLGVAVAPTMLPWVWLLLFGIGNGAVYPLSLTLPIDIGRSSNDVGALTAWMLALGAVPAAASPALVGALRDATGSFSLPLVLIAAACALTIPVALRLPPRNDTF